MNNMYMKAQRVQEEINTLTGFSATTMRIVMTNEQLLESMTCTTFVFDKLTDIFRACGITEKRLPTQRISAEFNKMLTCMSVNDIQLVNLLSLTDGLFKRIERFPTVERICGKADSEAERSLKQKESAMFKNGLAYFAARQVLIIKYKIGQVLEPSAAKAAERFLELTDGRRSMFAGLHQIANKLASGGLSPKDAKEGIEVIYRQGHRELAQGIRAQHGGYLGKVSLALKPNITQINAI